MAQQNKKRPQYINEMVAKVNIRLKVLNVKSINDTLFSWATDYLVSKGMYKGYNFYIDKYNEFKDTTTSVLAGSSDPDKYDYLQLY